MMLVGKFLQQAVKAGGRILCSKQDSAVWKHTELMATGLQPGGCSLMWITSAFLLFDHGENRGGSPGMDACRLIFSSGE